MLGDFLVGKGICDILALSSAMPILLSQWEEVGRYRIRCRPIGRKDWMEVRFHDYSEHLDHYSSNHEPITLQNGASGFLYHFGDTARWSEIALYTTKGHLRIKAPNKALTFTDWKKDDYSMALAILGTMRMTENGTSLFGITNPLGITLEIGEVTPNGATVIASHDDNYQHDAYWDEIRTHHDWYIQEYRDGTWVDLLPEDTTWSVMLDPVPLGGSRSFNLNWSQMTAPLESGRYRIAMTFAGFVQDESDQSLQGRLSQTCYVEFDLNAPDVGLGIIMELENITPDGATLVCTQDGTLWSDITTGADWNLMRYENGQLVSLLPESMVWTTEAYPIPTGESRSFELNWGRMIGSLEPGWYQIGKTFSGYEQITLHQSAKEPFTETRYVIFEINPLGISLHMEDITPGGGTLVCTQDDTSWESITTGADWTLERLTGEGWVSVLPEDTTWTAISIGVNLDNTTSWNLNWEQIVGELEPGKYRIGKNFMGFGSFTVEGSCAVGEGTQQTCYAEFIIGYYETLPDFSPELYQAVRDDWIAHDAMDEFDRLASSKTPGSCAREFDSWAEVEAFVGMEIANPLEGLESLEKGNWAAAPEGYNGGSRFYVTFSGTREGQIQSVNVQSGYHRGDLRVALDASLPADGQAQPLPAGQILHEDGDGWEARTVTVYSGNVEYTLRAMGDPGTGDELTALLQELLPYFEANP